MHTYVFEYGGGVISIQVDASTEQEAHEKFELIRSRKAPRLDPLCKVDGNVFLYSTEASDWEMFEGDEVEEDDPSHDGMSIAELVEHLSSDPGHQEELWGDFSRDGKFILALWGCYG